MSATLIVVGLFGLAILIGLILLPSKEKEKT